MKFTRPTRPGASLLIILLLFPFFFLAGPSYHSPRSLLALWNLGHLLFFLALVLFLASRRQEKKLTWSWSLTILLLATGLGLVIELIQGQIDGRVASLPDLARNSGGAILGLFLLAWPQQIRQRPALALGAGAIIVTSLLPVAAALVDEYRARRDFPLLSSFESSLELSRWEGDGQIERVKSPVSAGEYALAIRLTTAKYSGLNLHHFPRDWREMATLRLTINNQQATPMEITSRIHDMEHAIGEQPYHDRYNRRWTLEPGWNEISIDLARVAAAPAGRRMDMAHIRGLGLFVSRQEQERRVVIDEVRLLGEVN
ncbi:MAG: VanZ family protein [Thermodesulfobacteriota bacterium]